MQRTSPKVPEERVQQPNAEESEENHEKEDEDCAGVHPAGTDEVLARPVQRAQETAVRTRCIKALSLFGKRDVVDGGNLGLPASQPNLADSCNPKPPLATDRMRKLMEATPAHRKTRALATAVTDSQMANHIFSSCRMANRPQREVAEPHSANVATAITPEDCGWWGTLRCGWGCATPSERRTRLPGRSLRMPTSSNGHTQNCTPSPWRALAPRRRKDKKWPR